MGGLNINRQIFHKTGLIGLVALCVMIGILTYTTTVYGISLDLGLPLDIPALYDGGYLVEFSHLEGTGCMMLPVLQDVNTGEASSTTKKLMIRNTIDHLILYDLKITKVVRLPAEIRALMGTSNDSFKFVITAGQSSPVDITGLKMDISGMTCTMARLGMFEQDSNGVMKMLNMDLDNAKMTTHYQKMDKITMPGFALNLEFCDSEGN